jgi:hypothetical protein
MVEFYRKTDAIRLFAGRFAGIQGWYATGLKAEKRHIIDTIINP